MMPIVFSNFLKLSSSRLLLVILIIFLTNSCKSKLEATNDSFLSQYGSDVGQINSKRSDLLYKKAKENKKPKNFGWRSSGDIIGVSGPLQSSSAFVDTSDISLPEAPKQFSPDLQTLERAKVDPNLPKDMFKVSYNLKTYPKSYRKTKVSFDDIRIPGYDAFGVETDLGKKEYLLVDRQILQENVDYLDSSKTKEDKEISLILVNEQKDIKQKRILGILGEEEYYEEEEEEFEEELEDDVEEDLEEGSSKEDEASSGGVTRRLIKK